MRLLVFAGTRPEAIKLLPLVIAADRHPGFDCVFVSTGQHAEIFAQVIAGFGRRPDLELGLMTADQTLTGLTARLLVACADAIHRFRPDFVIVQGDTSTALAASIAAFQARTPLGHVEAGLRSHDLDRPFPEEGYRRMIDVQARLLFAPSEASAANLRAEGFPAGRVIVTGNSGIDALMLMRDRLAEAPSLAGAVSGHVEDGQPLILVTAHRRESFGAGLEGIAAAVRRLAERPGLRIVLPVHPNPNVAPLRAGLAGLPGVRLIDPVSYAEMVWLIDRAHVILTDSGGLQEEAPALGRPVLVMRDVTERPEVVALGAARLVGTCPDRIVAEASRLLDDPAAHAAMARPALPYGRGDASAKILDAIGAMGG